MKLRIITGLVTLILVGCSSTGTTQNRTLAKVAPSMVKPFLSQDGCNEIFNIEFLRALPDGDYFGKKLTKEHWRAEGCGKTYNLEMSVSKDGKYVVVHKL